jgi:hypothetical protein
MNKAVRRPAHKSTSYVSGIQESEGLSGQRQGRPFLRVHVIHNGTHS